MIDATLQAYVGGALQAYWTVSVLPPNSTPWERAVEATCANLVAQDPVYQIVAARSVQDCPPALLPYLAAERAVDEWDSGWTVAQRQAVVGGSFAYHQRQGTRHALDLALAPLGYALTVSEWFETTPAGAPYTFSIAVTVGQAATWLASDFQQLARIANRAKNAHTMLSAIEPTRMFSTGFFAGGAPTKNRSLIVTQTAPFSLAAALNENAYLRVAGALARSRAVIVQPRSIQ